MMQRLTLPILLAVLTTISVMARPAGPVTISGTVVDDALTPLAGVLVTLLRETVEVARATTDAGGRYTLPPVTAGAYVLKAANPTGVSVSRPVEVREGPTRLTVPLVLAVAPVQVAAATEVVAVTPPPSPAPLPPAASQAVVGRTIASQPSIFIDRAYAGGGRGGYGDRHGGDRYADVEPSRFQRTVDHPLSTFGADVDTASYANVRRFLNEGQLPPAEAVRIEELLNYFRPSYTAPTGGAPIALTAEISDAPWNPRHKLALIGVKARPATDRPEGGRNIVLLIDVSGSMSSPDRLPLLKTALALFVDSLQPDDRLAIVTYAGTSGVHLPSTPARDRRRLQASIDRLHAGGSTNGAQGIVTAYRVAREAFIPGGINRVILATDGDFNVGVTSQDALVRLIERERESGVFLSIFGVGRGNLNDASLEAIANKGNGHYVYLDSLQEARRVMLRETDALLETVAKDVKFQVEFNPRMVGAWKLIGYENRVMAARDFNDDRKDGGELGAGHTVTMLYELVPAGAPMPADGGVDPLKYQPEPPQSRPQPRPELDGEWFTVKARYKEPDDEESRLIERAVRGGRARYVTFAAAVAEFGMLLRDGDGRSERWTDLVARVHAAPVDATMTVDKAAFIELVETARGLMRLRSTPQRFERRDPGRTP